MVYILGVSRFTLLLVFAISLFSKLSDFKSFLHTLSLFSFTRSLSTFVRSTIARVVLLLEILIVLLLSLTFRTAVVGFSLSAVVLAMFTYVLIKQLRDNPNLSCGCFGRWGLTDRITIIDVIRNTLLIAVSFAGIAASYNVSLSSVTIAPYEHISMFFAALIATLLITNASLWAELFFQDVQSDMR